MEKQDVWKWYEAQENKQQALTLLSAAAEQPVNKLLNTQGFRRDAQVTAIAPGALTMLKIPPSTNAAVVLTFDGQALAIDINPKPIVLDLVELSAEITFTENTAPTLEQSLAIALAVVEDQARQDLLAVLPGQPGTRNLILQVRTPPTVLPLLDDQTGEVRFLVFELVAVALLYQAAV